MPKEIQSCKIADIHNTPMKEKQVLHYTLMAKGYKEKCHIVQRQREFTLKLQRNIREVREESTSTKSTKFAFIAQA